MFDFVGELRKLLNIASRDSGSNTPDFVLAEYLESCLQAFERAVLKRAEWYGRIDVPGRGSLPYPAGDEDRVLDAPTPAREGGERER